MWKGNKYRAVNWGDTLVLIGVVTLLWLFAPVRQSAGSVVIVNGDGKKMVLDLPADTLVEVKGRIGVSVVEIKGRRVRMLSSPCPHKLCMERGWVGAGGVIVCLPQGIIVKVEGEARVDAITE